MSCSSIGTSAGTGIFALAIDTAVGATPAKPVFAWPGLLISALTRLTISPTLSAMDGPAPDVAPASPTTNNNN